MIGVCVIVIAVLAITIAIPNYKYDKAEVLFNNGDYQEAAVIYSELGDLKDSVSKTSECKWNMFINWLNEQNDDVSYTNKYGTFFVAQNVKTLGIRFTFCCPIEKRKMLGYNFASAGVFYLDVSFGNKDGDLEGSAYYAAASEKGTATIDISKYDFRSAISRSDWNTSKSTASDSYRGMILERLSLPALQGIKKGIQTVINDSGLDITMADLGFKAIE